MPGKRVHVNKRIVSVPDGDDVLGYVKRFRETLLSGFGVVALLSPPERRYRQTALDQHHDL